MAGLLRFATAAVLLLTSTPAAASGADGLLAFMIGIPLLTLMTGAFLWAIRKPRSRRTTFIMLALACPFIVYSLFILPDALSTFQRPAGSDALIGVAYVTLLGLMVGLIVRLVRNCLAPEPSGPPVGL